MSKAILVLEMPSKCIQCPCCNIGAFYDVCRALHEITTCADNGKPDWCPLNPMAETKEEYRVLYNQYGDAIGTRNNNFNTGYNACIDEILGGSE